MLFADLAGTSLAVAGTAARSAKIALLADWLRRADPAEGEVAVCYLAGDLRQRRTGVGWAGLRNAPEPAAEASLTVAEVDALLERIATVSGAGSATARRGILDELMARATAPEQHMLRGLLAGELRQGAQEGVMAEAVARAAGVPAAEVRRAAMLRGSLAAVARVALAEGTAGLAAFGLQVGRPILPMLASTATSVADAFDRLGTSAAVDWKLDGIRVQIHRDADAVAVYTRTLEEITDRVPEVVAAARTLPVSTVVLDGEVIALGADGRPRRFQETASRVARRQPLAGPDSSTPADAALSTYIFDVLHVDGQDLLGLPARDRFAASDRIVPAGLSVPRVVTADPAEAAGHYDAALRHRHEGVVIKSLTAPYEAGRRGAGWVKVKPRHTLDLVVLAVEWGSGRRRGWLSNLHLGARDPVGGFVMLGKTFKGLTDELLRWQTERLLALEVSRNEWQVFVRPELVVEIAFDGVQTSSRYPGGMALRFARVLRYRPDKRADEADTLETVRAIHEH